MWLWYSFPNKLIKAISRAFCVPNESAIAHILMGLNWPLDLWRHSVYSCMLHTCMLMNSRHVWICANKFLKPCVDFPYFFPCNQQGIQIVSIEEAFVDAGHQQDVRESANVATPTPIGASCGQPRRQWQRQCHNAAHRQRWLPADASHQWSFYPWCRLPKFAAKCEHQQQRNGNCDANTIQRPSKFSFYVHSRRIFRSCATTATAARSRMATTQRPVHAITSANADP